jgi:hypothetical protein
MIHTIELAKESVKLPTLSCWFFADLRKLENFQKPGTSGYFLVKIQNKPRTGVL